MNYYEHHIGDYAAATAHLSWDEDMAYTRLLRAYYHHERGIPQGQEYRLARAITPAQKRAVDAVLAEFFTLVEGVFTQKRAEEEIALYQEGKPEREARKANEHARLRRHREERAKLFKAITEAGHHAAWNIGMSELRELAKRCMQPLPETAPATLATATHTQTPDTRHQSNKPPIAPRKRVASVHGFPAGFEEFWSAYPRKTAKPKAAKAFARLAPDAELRGRILAAVSAAKASADWQKDGGRFIPHPATWLNDCRWEDESPSVSSIWEGAA